MHEEHAGFANVLSDTSELEAHYRPPSQVVLDKDTDVLDDGCREFIDRSTFVLVASSNRDGDLDVSPRGGPLGFVKVLDDHRLANPDLNGNNRLDSIKNVIEHERVGLLFLIPGMGETLRINGRACITTDDSVLDRFTDEFKRPKTAIGVTIDQGFIHCAKSIRRANLWEPGEWPGAEEQPSAGEILVAHSGLEGIITGEQLDTSLDESYVRDLAADRPDGPPASGD